MTRNDDRRRRIVRVRTVEHRIAQQELALARRGARQIESVIERIEMLARDNILSTGIADGASLAAISEMTTRLAHARSSTSGPLEQALQRVSARQADHVQTNAKAENASRILKKAVQQNAADADARLAAARCYPPIIARDEI